MDKRSLLKYGKNTALVLALLGAVAGLNIAVQNNTSISDEAKQEQSKQVKLNIALVNEDNAVTSAGQVYNLGASYVKNIERNTEHNWSTVSRGTADKGLKEGRYQLVVTIPNDFSKKILDLNNANVDKATVTYKINANGNSQVENVANIVAKDIIADLRSQLIDMYMASILGNLYQAQRNVEILSQTKEDNIGIYRESLYQNALNFKSIFPNLVSTANSTLAANELLKETLSSNTTVFDSIDTAQQGLQSNLASLVEQRSQGKISQEQFASSLMEMSSSVLSAETSQLFDTIKGTQSNLTNQLGNLGAVTPEGGANYRDAIGRLEQEVIELRVAVESERAKLQEQKNAISNFADEHLASQYGNSFDNVDLRTVLSANKEAGNALEAYQSNLDKVILDQLNQLPSLDETELSAHVLTGFEGYLNGMSFDSSFATSQFGSSFSGSDDFSELEKLKQELDKHIQLDASFKAPENQMSATVTLTPPPGFSLVSREMNGQVYTEDTAQVVLTKENQVTATLEYSKTTNTVIQEVAPTPTPAPPADAADSEEVAPQPLPDPTKPPISTEERVTAPISIAINNVVTSTDEFDWEGFKKEQESYRKAEAAYVGKLSSIVAKYNQVNTLLATYYPVSQSGVRKSLSDTYFDQNAKPMLKAMLVNAITANLKSYGERLDAENTLNEKLEQLENTKSSLKEQISRISQTNVDLGGQITA